MKRSTMVIHEKAKHVHIFRKRQEILPHDESCDIVEPLQIWYLPDGGIFFACGYDKEDGCYKVWAFSVFNDTERSAPNRIPRWFFDAIPDEAFAGLRGRTAR